MGGVPKDEVEYAVVEYRGVNGKVKQFVGYAEDLGDIFRVHTDDGVVDIYKLNTTSIQRFPAKRVNFFGVEVPTVKV